MKTPRFLIDGRRFKFETYTFRGIADEPIEHWRCFVDGVKTDYDDIKHLLSLADQMACDYLIEIQQELNAHFDVDAWIR